MKSNKTGLPYVLSVDSVKDAKNRNTLRAIVSGAAAFLTLLFATKSYVEFDQVMGGIYTAATYPLLASTIAFGIMAEDQESKEK